MRLDELERQHQRLRQERPEGLSEDATPEDMTRATEEAHRRWEAAEEAWEAARAALQRIEDRRRECAQALQQLEEGRRRAAVWLRLHELIGVREGQQFREFAQSLNLDRLIRKANEHLARLSPRYRLAQKLQAGVPTLEFTVVDLWQVATERIARGLAGSERSPRTLSGGERFLVSLALALGLSDLRSSSLPIETLLLDEGFGTLDPRTLDMALKALGSLQQEGRRVGVISHVEGLKEYIPARVAVEPLGGGRSRVVLSRG